MYSCSQTSSTDKKVTATNYILYVLDTITVIYFISNTTSFELSRSRPPIVIIIMSEFKVGGTLSTVLIYTLLNIIRIIRNFIVTQYFIDHLGI